MESDDDDVYTLKSLKRLKRSPLNQNETSHIESSETQTDCKHSISSSTTGNRKVKGESNVHFQSTFSAGPMPPSDSEAALGSEKRNSTEVLRPQSKTLKVNGKRLTKALTNRKRTNSPTSSKARSNISPTCIDDEAVSDIHNIVDLTAVVNTRFQINDLSSVAGNKATAVSGRLTIYPDKKSPFDNDNKNKKSQRCRKIRQSSKPLLKSSQKKASDFNIVKKTIQGLAKTVSTMPCDKGFGSENDNRCPFCQMPFRALLGQSLDSHTMECMDLPLTSSEECPKGFLCDNTIPSHYRRFRHSELAQQAAGIMSTVQISGGHSVCSSLEAKESGFFETVETQSGQSEKSECKRTLNEAGQEAFNKTPARTSQKKPNVSAIMPQKSKKRPRHSQHSSVRYSQESKTTGESGNISSIKDYFSLSPAKTTNNHTASASLMVSKPVGKRDGLPPDFDPLLKLIMAIAESESDEEDVHNAGRMTNHEHGDCPEIHTTGFETKGVNCGYLPNTDSEQRKSAVRSGLNNFQDLCNEGRETKSDSLEAENPSIVGDLDDDFEDLYCSGAWESSEDKSIYSQRISGKSSEDSGSFIIESDVEEKYFPDFYDKSPDSLNVRSQGSSNTNIISKDKPAQKDILGIGSLSAGGLPQVQRSVEDKYEEVTITGFSTVAHTATKRQTSLFSFFSPHCHTVKTDKQMSDSSKLIEKGKKACAPGKRNSVSKISVSITKPSVLKSSSEPDLGFGLPPRPHSDNAESRGTRLADPRNTGIAGRLLGITSKSASLVSSAASCVIRSVGQAAKVLPQLRASGESASKTASGGQKKAGRQCPFYKRLPGTAITVDAFNYGEIPGCQAYVLTHFHYDHYQGLNKKFSQPLYCSAVTANLVEKQLGVQSQWVNRLPMGIPTQVTGVWLTLMEANHCPGAAIILFELPNGKKLLHTGDFRADPCMEQYPPLIMVAVDELYLDTTYCDPAHAFPSQKEAIDFAVFTALKTVEQNPNTLIVCGAYTIGKERIFIALAEALQSKICVQSAKKRVLDCLDDARLRSRVTLKWNEGRVHVLPMGKLNSKGLEDHMALCSKFSSILAFEPTGWTHSKKTISLSNLRPKFSCRGITIYGVPYSEHSSFLELKRFVQFVKPKKILPTVNNGNHAARQKMEAIFRQWMAEASQPNCQGTSRQPAQQQSMGSWLKK